MKTVPLFVKEGLGEIIELIVLLQLPLRPPFSKGESFLPLLRHIRKGGGQAGVGYNHTL